AKFDVRGEPALGKLIALPCQLFEHIAEILGQEMREHEAVVKHGPPADQALASRVLPESGDHGPEEKLLHQAHPRVRRHLEAAKLDQAQATRTMVRREELIDAPL